MKYSAIVLCAGSGSRAGLGYNKVLYQYEGKPVFLYAVESFLSDSMCTQILIVTKTSEKEAFKSVLDEQKDTRIQYVDGGKERSDSVANAVKHVKENIVLIHDAARGRIDKVDLNVLCEALGEYDAALLGLPVVDTVKRVSNMQVIGTEDRETLFLAQTPQAFHTVQLQQLMREAKESELRVTDEIMLVEQLVQDAKIKMLRGSVRYSKLTYKEDFGRK